MKSEQIIESIASKYGFYQDDPIIKAIWNGAVEECAKEACTDCHCVEGYCNGIDKSSILSLKIEDDEK